MPCADDIRYNTSFCLQSRRHNLPTQVPNLPPNTLPLEGEAFVACLQHKRAGLTKTYTYTSAARVFIYSSKIHQIPAQLDTLNS